MSRQMESGPYCALAWASSRHVRQNDNGVRNDRHIDVVECVQHDIKVAMCNYTSSSVVGIDAEKITRSAASRRPPGCHKNTVAQEGRLLPPNYQ